MDIALITRSTRTGDALQHIRNRAPRIEIQLPLRYRDLRKMTWHSGHTLNISRTGMLIHAEALMQMRTRIVLSFELPVLVNGEIGAWIVCHARVVRAVGSPPQDAQPTLALRILQYRFIRVKRNSRLDVQ